MCSYVSPSSRESHDQGLEVINESSMYRFKQKRGLIFLHMLQQQSPIQKKKKKKKTLEYHTERYLLIFFFFFFAALHSAWDLSSLTRDQTHAPCIGSADFHRTAREVPQRYLKVQVINGKHFSPLILLSHPHPNQQKHFGKQ